MAARISLMTLFGRKMRDRGVPVDVEDEVRALIYGEHSGAVAPLRPSRPHGAHRLAGEALSVAGACPIRPQPAASEARSRDDSVRDDRLSAALLGELEPAAREEVLARAVVKLSRAGLPAGDAREGGAVSVPRARATHKVRPRGRPRRPGAGAEAPALVKAGRVFQRSIVQDDRSATMPCYRVVIDRGCGEARSRVEFSTRARSARGVVAANVRTGSNSVSAVNEAEPADRFSWRPHGSCQCTPGTFADCPNGSKLDREGWCRECGLQVLPPLSGAAGV